jgi:cytoskeletal protein CcmA (bactofilin family)
MFRRKRPEGDTPKSGPDAFEELHLPVRPGVRPAAGGSTASAAPTVPARPPVIPPRPTDGQRPTGEPARRPDGTPQPAADLGRRPESQSAPKPPAQPAKREAELRKLIVGREILVAGEITSCDWLVVEGSVEANLANCRDMEISDTGVYKGSASIENAEIRGRFDGVLNVRRRLLIRATGRVTGTVRYGQLEIECGGQIAGEVQAQPTTNELPPSLTEPPRPLIATPSEPDLVE